MIRIQLLCATVGGVLLAEGCSRHEDVTSYTAAKSPQVRAAVPANAGETHHGEVATDAHMRAAIVLRGEKAWFFKATGPPPAMADRAQAFAQFVKSVRFGADGTPAWTLPPGWSQKPGNSQRFATIEIGGVATPLALTVTVLSKNEDDVAYLLANVDRWRGQLGLPPTTAAAVSQLATLPLADGSRAILVELAGREMRGEAKLPSGHPPTSVSAPPHLAAVSKAAVAFVTPTGWTPQPPRGSRRAAFTVRDGERSVEITLQSFPAAAPLIADPLANFNRWRGELGLDETAASELERAGKKLTISGQPAWYFEITGPSEPKQRAILAALFKLGEEMWFVKLFGDAPLAQRERERLAAFLGSLRIGPQGEPVPGGQ
jgi:hypothetical protein